MLTFLCVNPYYKVCFLLYFTHENNREQTINLQNIRKELENEYIKLKSQANDLEAKLDWFEQ